MRPAVVVVGLGRVRVILAVVWLMVKAVSTSTVVVLAPIGALAAKLPKAWAVLRVEPLLVNWEPLIVRLALAWSKPAEVIVPLPLVEILPLVAMAPDQLIEPVVKAPVPVMAVATASVVSTRAVSRPSNRLN